MNKNCLPISASSEKWNFFRAILMLGTLAILLGAALLPTGLVPAPVVQAQGINIPCTPPSRPPSLARELAKEIPEYVGGESSVPRGPFFENKIVVEIIGNDATVCLSSSPVELRPPKVDDQIELVVGDDKTRTETWVYDFYDQKTKGITEIPAQDVSRLFAHGSNTVRITLRDLKPRFYSTRPIWLLIWQGTPPTATPTITPSPTKTLTPTPAPTNTPTPTPMPRIAIGTDRIDLGKLESLADGQNVVVRIASTSVQTETLTVTVAGLSGSSVTPTQVDVGPKADTDIALRIASASDLVPKVYAATLVFAARSGITLVNSKVQITFEIVAPILKIEPAEVNLGNLDGIGSDTVANLRVTSSNPRNDPLRVESVEPSDIQVRVDPETILANQTVEVKLHLASSRSWTPGDYAILVKFARPRPQVGVTPDTITIRFHVPSPLERFGPPVGGLLGLLLFGAVVLWLRIPAPIGQLIGISAPTGKAQNYYLSKYISPLKGYDKAVAIGRVAGNDIRLNHSSVAERHARIAAERREVPQTIGRGARQKTVSMRRVVTVLFDVGKTGRCTVNDSSVPPTGQPLKHGDRVQIGDYVFEYR